MAKKKKQAIETADTVLIEGAMEELEAIVEAMESGQTSLSESLERFERGMVLLRSCHKQLDVAAQRIEMLSSVSDNGDVFTTPFDGTATVAQTSEDEEEDGESGVLF